MLRSKALLQLVCSTVILGAAFAGSSRAQENSSGLNNHNSNAPVDYAADRIELQDQQNRVLLSGNVDIKQDALRMKADRTVVLYTNDNGIKIKRLDAINNVQVTRGDESATANLGTYDFNKRTITLVGNVVLHRNGDISRGDRLVIDLDAHHSAFVGSAGPNGAPPRVTGTFSVTKK